MGVSRFLAKKLLKTGFAVDAVRENADLSVFRQKPSGKVLWGLVCIATSYMICWPVISALGVFAVYIRRPAVVIIGAPVIWMIAHFLCMFGLYLSGADHTRAIAKWLVRVFLEKHVPEKIPGKSPDGPLPP